LESQSPIILFLRPNIENQKITIGSIHMEGKAIFWYHWLMDSGPVRSWEDFVVALKVRFSPSAFDDPLGDSLSSNNLHLEKSINPILRSSPLGSRA
jgi:hypothetical protein